MNATSTESSRALRFGRISNAMLGVPCIIVLATLVLLGVDVLGGPVLSAYPRFFWGARTLWLCTGVVGFLCAAVTMSSRDRGRGRLLMALHFVSTFVAWVAGYFQYLGHPD